MALLRLLPATLKLGARGRLLQRHSLFLNMGRCISVQGCRAVFGSASCWKKWFHLRGASVVRMRSFYVMSGNLVFFVIKQKLSLDNIVLGGLGTDETSVALSPFFEVAGYNFGQMRAQKWFRLTDPILVPSLYLGTETGSAGRTLNLPLQTARFTFQALLEFDGRVSRVCGWAG